MQQYAKQALNFAGYYVNAAKQWWQPSQQIPESPVEQLKLYLQKSNIEFKTKHSQQKILTQRLCMMYSELIAGQGSKYQNFKPSNQRPIQYIITNLSQENQIKIKQQDSSKKAEQTNKGVVSIFGYIQVKTQKINCKIIVTILIHSQIQNELPQIYIRNPDAYKTQPNPKYFNNSSKNTNKKVHEHQERIQIYSPILGGVTLSGQQKKLLADQWKQYKSTNLFNLVSKIDKLLHQYFPFVKRYSQFQTLATNSEQYQKIVNLSKILKQYLPKVQRAQVLYNCINSEISHLKNQNNKLSQILQSNQKSEKNIENVIKLFKIEQNEQLMQLICMQRAYIDCLRLVEDEQRTDGYETIAETVKLLSSKLFQIRFKIKEEVTKASNSSAVLHD